MFDKDRVSRRTVLQTTGGSVLALGATGLASAAPDDRVTVNVGFASERGRKAALDAASETVREFDSIDALTLRLPKQAASALEKNPNVRYVEENGQMQALSWGRDRIDAEVAYSNGYTGSGADVAVLDTGIDADNPCLPNVGSGKAFVNCSSGCQTAWDDDNGHGTNVAGLIGASPSCDCTTGVAPGATLHAVKVLNDWGSGSFSDIAAGIEYVADQGWDVANISLGASSGSQAIEDACTYAYDQGVLLVGAAGGSGPCSGGCVGYPAAYSEVIAVSATNENDEAASFSSRGPEIELAAPGTNLTTTDAGGSCTTLSGTSFSAAYVSGVGALLMGQGYVNSAARVQMQSTAEDLGLPSNVQGHGLVDAAAAVGLNSSDN